MAKSVSVTASFNASSSLAAVSVMVCAVSQLESVNINSVASSAKSVPACPVIVTVTLLNGRVESRMSNVWTLPSSITTDSGTIIFPSSLSVIVISTTFGVPAMTVDGSPLSWIATINVSSSSPSLSSVIPILTIPVVLVPAPGIVMLPVTKFP